jgi:hypothetical protein
MTVMPFDERPSSPSSRATQPTLPDGRPHGDDRKERAVAQLLEHGMLSHVFGQHGEYRVQTTMTTRQGWQYRCCVLRRGKAIRGAFFPIIVERTPPLLLARLKVGDAEDMRLSFVQEAVDVHFTRCAALGEYLALSAIYDQPLSQSRQWSMLLALSISIVFVVVYGFWAYAPRTNSVQQPASPPPLVTERHEMRKPSSVPLPVSSHTAPRNDIDEQPSASPTTHPVVTPVAVSVNELLDIEDPLERAGPTARAFIPRTSPGAMESDVQVRDVLVLSGWLRRVSRAPDNTYHLYVSPDRNAGARDLIAMVPPPDQTPGSPDVKAQLQTVRTFIRRQLLRQREPSPRGSVMQRPVFVQLTGHLSYPDGSTGEPAQGKQSRDATVRWQMRPVLEVQFATPPTPSERSQAQ